MQILSLSLFIIQSYGPIAILFLLAFWGSRHHREKLSKLMVWLNFYLLVGAIIFVFSLINYIFIENANTNQWEEYSLLNRFTGPYWLAYGGPLFFKGLLPQLLWLKKVRSSIWFMILYLPTSIIGAYLPKLYLIFFSDNDFVPITFSLTLFIIPTISFLFLLVGIFYFTRKKE